MRSLCMAKEDTISPVFSTAGGVALVLLRSNSREGRPHDSATRFADFIFVSTGKMSKTQQILSAKKISGGDAQRL